MNIPTIVSKSSHYRGDIPSGTVTRHIWLPNIVIKADVAGYSTKLMMGWKYIGIIRLE